jgi:hypothetical protein
MKSGAGVWTLNPRAKTWKLSYGTSAALYSSRFFGVAIPDETPSDFGNGIRFNYGT